MDAIEPTSFTDSAFDHGITERQIREVLINGASEDFEIGQDEDNDPCEMIVGFDSFGNLLEIGICYEHLGGMEIGIRVFHAWKAREQWMNGYNVRKQHPEQV
jgi:hypothetical protein